VRSPVLVQRIRLVVVVVAHVPDTDYRQFRSDDLHLRGLFAEVLRIPICRRTRELNVCTALPMSDGRDLFDLLRGASNLRPSGRDGRWSIWKGVAHAGSAAVSTSSNPFMTIASSLHSSTG